MFFIKKTIKKLVSFNIHFFGEGGAAAGTGAPGEAAPAAGEHGIVWNQIINAQRIPTDIYGINGIPTIMLIGPDGTILDRTMRGEQIMKVVSENLGR